MTVNITSYSGLNSAVQAWMARLGDAVLSSRFDDFLALAERRIYYGYADPTGTLQSDPLRITEMETVNSTFSVTSDTVAQPMNFIELISAYSTTINSPMEIVAQRVIDGYGAASIGGAKLIAVSGSNFRVTDAPTAASPANLVLRYYQKLTTPTASAANTILTSYPDIYLYACLLEAAVYTQDSDSAMKYLLLYNASVSGLNARRERITASANPVIRVRSGMNP